MNGPERRRPSPRLIRGLLLVWAVYSLAALLWLAGGDSPLPGVICRA